MFDKSQLIVSPLVNESSLPFKTFPSPNDKALIVVNSAWRKKETRKKTVSNDILRVDLLFYDFPQFHHLHDDARDAH